LRSGIRYFLFVLGVTLLIPEWILDVHWGAHDLHIDVLPWFCSCSFTLPLIVAKCLLFLLVAGTIPLILRLPSLAKSCIQLWSRKRIISVCTAVFLFALGSVCLEPSPLYIRSLPIQFDVGRNVLLSMFPLIRFIGLVCFVIGIGAEGRNRLASTVNRWLEMLSSLSLGKSVVLLISTGLILGILFSIIGYKQLPSIRDEVAALFQAGIFQSGRVVAEPPAWHEFMDMSPILTHPSWSSMYPPGWSAVLAIGGVLNIQWLVNPMLSGVIGVLVFILLRRQINGYAAWLGLLLLFTSPFFLRLSGSYMSHHYTLVLLLIAYVLIFTDKPRTVFTGIISGVAIGFAFGTRPWSAACLGLPLAVLGIRELRYSEQRSFWLGCAFGCIVSVVPIAYYNELSTGNWYTTGYVARLGPKGSMGFGEKAMGLHTPLLGLLHNAGRLYRLNVDIFGTPIPGIWIVGLGLLCGLMNVSATFLLLGFFILWLGSGLYWWYEHWFGPRYLFEGIPALILCASMGIDALLRKSNFKPYVLSGFAVSICWGLVAVIPQELHDLSTGYGEVDRITVKQLRDPSISNSAVIIQDSDANAWPHDTYTSAFLAMVLEDFKGAIMLRDLGPENRILQDLLPQKDWHYYCHGETYGSGTLFQISGSDFTADTTSVLR